MRTIFLGSPEFAVPALAALSERHEVALVVTQPDKPAGRGQKLVAPPVKQLAEARGLPVAQPRSARTPEFRALLEEQRADVAVVVAYGKILPGPVLATARLGFVNIHGSLLPRYRGAAPIQWAIINGERETGITIMHLDEGMDTGPMLLERALPIAVDDTAGALMDKLAPIGAALLLEALDGLERGSLPDRPQDHAAASYAPMLRKEDGVIDWTRPAEAVRDRIRGVDPWPGATSALAGEPIKLFRPRAESGSGLPGEVLGVGDGGLRVACGEGVCAIGELQLPGRKRMAAHALVAGRPIPPGTRLG